MHTLPISAGATNDSDPRPVMNKFRLNELKIILKGDGQTWTKKGESDQLTAEHARMLIVASQIDITPYVGYDNRGFSYFVHPDGTGVMEVTKKAEVDDANRTASSLEITALKNTIKELEKPKEKVAKKPFMESKVK